MSDDGWITVAMRGGAAGDPYALFNQQHVRIPYPSGAPERGNWQMHPEKPDVVRFVYAEGGALKASRNNGSRDTYRSISKQSLQTAMGRVLTGRFAAKVQGMVVEIDLSERQS